MMRTLRLAGVAGVVGIAALGSACAAGTPSVGATPSPSAAARTSGPLADPDSAKRVVYDERLVSDPLPASSARTAKATLSAEEAVEIGTRVGRSPDLQPGDPTTSLRMVYGGDPDGARKVAGKPSWVLTWRDSAPAVRGGPNLSDAERQAMADSLTCVYVVTVDTASKAPTNSVQFCEAK